MKLRSILDTNLLQNLTLNQKMNFLRNQILKNPHPKLRNNAEFVDTPSFYRNLATKMLLVMNAADGIGLAANQIGRQECIFVYKFGKIHHAVVNPIVTYLSDEKDTDLEGCLSVPGTAVEVERSNEIHLKGFSPSGEPIEIKASGYEARIIQHELDHLIGKLIIDYLEGTNEQN